MAVNCKHNGVGSVSVTRNQCPVERFPQKHSECISQGPYTFGHLKFKAIQDLLRLFEKEIQDCFNDDVPLIGVN